MVAEAFNTVDEAEEGVKLPLRDKFGDLSDEWMLVRGVDSPVFREARIEGDRECLALISEPDKGIKYKKIMEIKARTIAALVKDWSKGLADDLGKPTVKNVAKFLMTAPQLQDEIDRLSGSREVFFSMKQKSLSIGAESKQSSTEPPQTQK